MKCRPVFCLLCLLMPALVAAQAQGVPDAPAATPLQVQQERSRIQRSRAQVHAEAEQANAACYQKFAVSDCLREVRTNTRLVLDALRRQEVILNDLERQAKAISALRKIEEKSLGEARLLRIAPQEKPADR